MTKTEKRNDKLRATHEKLQAAVADIVPVTTGKNPLDQVGYGRNQTRVLFGAQALSPPAMTFPHP
jgi:hypothetical protein